MSAAIETRLAEARDCPAAHMHRDLIADAIATRRCWVAERAARVIGYGVLSTHFFGRDFIELVFIVEDARRTGAGSAILGAIEKAVRGDRLFTSTNESNTPMRALLAKQGYVESGRVDNLDDGDPELVFVKFLRR